MTGARRVRMTCWSVRLLAAALATSAHATIPEPTFMQSGPRVAPPRGYLEFCAREPVECPEFPHGSDPHPLATASGSGSASDYWRLLFASVYPAALPHAGEPSDAAPMHNYGPPDPHSSDINPPAVVTITDQSWREIIKVNRSVNEAIRPRSDMQTYGVEDYWAVPLKNGRREGDCEDYVLEKRRALRKLGYPDAALSIALVKTPWRQDHAVLLVDTDRGEIVLDSLSPWVLSWRAVSYRWISRQSPTDPAVWVSGPSYRQ